MGTTDANTEPPADQGAPAPVEKPNAGPTAPTVGAAIGSAIGLYLGSLIHAGPMLDDVLTVTLAAVVSGGLHVLCTELGIPDPFA
jgi:hypothetical protein